MSDPRPITRAIKQVREMAEEIKISHTIDGKWPTEETEARMHYLRLHALASLAEKEFKDLRQKELRLSQLETLQVPA